MTPEEYHAAEGLSSTALRCFMFEGNLKFFHKHVQKSLSQDESRALELGKLFHTAMERPSDWEKDVFIMPSAVPDGPVVDAENSKLSKAAYKAVPGEEWNLRKDVHRKIQASLSATALALGQEVVSEAEYQLIRDQVNSVWDNQACRDVLEGMGIRSEMAVFAESDKLPFRLKSLIDMSDPDTVIDFKTTRHHHYSRFLRDAFNRGYQWQMAYYCLVSERSQAKIISVTNEPPFEANLYTISASEISRLIDGHDGIKSQIRSIKQLYESMAADSVGSIDSCGVPLGWHSDRWGSEIPFDLRIASGADID